MEKTIHIEIRFTRAAAVALFSLAVVMGALGLLLLKAGPAAAGPGSDAPLPQAVDSITASVANKIYYQGRLDGASGPVEMTFRLWTSALGTEMDDLLWSETKTVEVTGGLFSTQLGDTTPLRDQAAEGRELWLGVEVEHDGEMVPRQEILPVPYAMSLRPGARITGSLPDDKILDISNTQGGGLSVYGLSHTEPAAFFYNPFGVAVKARGSIQSTAESYQWFPGDLARVRVGTSGLTLYFHGDGLVRLDATTDGTKRIVIPLSVPAVLYGQPVAVTSLRIPYRCDDVTSDSYISELALYRHDGAGRWRRIVSDTSIYTCTEGDTWRNIDITVDEDNLLSADDGILNLEISAYMLAGGSANQIYIGGARVGLAHDSEPALQQASGQ